MTFDPMSVEVTCVTLPKDHCVQVPWQYINVCGYSDQFCKIPHTYTYYIHATYYVHTTYRMSDHTVSYWTQFRRDKKVQSHSSNVHSRRQIRRRRKCKQNIIFQIESVQTSKRAQKSKNIPSGPTYIAQKLHVSAAIFIQFASTSWIFQQVDWVGTLCGSNYVIYSCIQTTNINKSSLSRACFISCLRTTLLPLLSLSDTVWSSIKASSSPHHLYSKHYSIK